MRVALVSLNQAWEDKNVNTEACSLYMQQAKAQGAELVIFPEMTLTSYSMNASLISENKDTSETVALFVQLAIRFQIAIIFGVVFQDEIKAKNNAVVIDSAGRLSAVYSKIHPFSFAGEDKVYSPGNEIGLAEVDSVTIGLTICYDLRFPELYSALAKKTELIVVIANWPNKRLDHWNTLLKARAIENQLFIIGVNRTGRDGNGLEYTESSQVINPSGEMLIPDVVEDVLAIYDIDLELVNIFKQKFSTVQDRKPELYKTIL